MTSKNVLFLCRDNAAVSIMAEAYTNVAGRGIARAYSAGCQPASSVHPVALATLRAAGVRHSGLAPKSWNQFAHDGEFRMDLVVYLSDPRSMTQRPAWRGAPPEMVLKPSGSDVVEIPGARQSEMLEVFAEIRTLADSLLLDMPGIITQQYPAVA